MIHPTSTANNLEFLMYRSLVPGPASERTSYRRLVSIFALLFIASAALTIIWCSSMASMGEMRMPGDWTMSMVWMRMPGQTWLQVAASFIGMWIVMMVAMMLPSLLPMILHYRQAVDRPADARLGWPTALVGGGYFFVWTAFGIAVFPLGVALAQVEMQWPTLSRAVPISVGVVVVLAGVFQFTALKKRYLATCGEAPEHGRKLPADSVTSCRHGLHGLRLGIDCARTCSNLMTILLVIGVMDIGVMAVVTTAITVERLAPNGALVARMIGVVAVGAGLFLIVRALVLG